MTPTVDRALILAGGLGTRLRPLTIDTPKPLLPLLGRPILRGWLDRLATAGITRVDILVGADPSPFIPMIGAGRGLALHVTVRPEPFPLGSAGAVRAALPHAETTVLVINADVATGASLRALIGHHRHHRPEVTLLLGTTTHPSEFGGVDTDGCAVTRFREKPRADDRCELANVGVYVVRGSALSGLAVGTTSSLERDVFPQLLAEGRQVNGAFTSAPWADLGTPARYVTAHGDALTGSLAWPLPHSAVIGDSNVWAHPTAAIHPRAIVRQPVLLGPGAVVSPGAMVGPKVVLGRNARVLPGARVANAVLHDHATVQGFATVQHAVVGQHATVPAEARVIARVVSLHSQPAAESPVDGCRPIQFTTARPEPGRHQ